MHLDVKLSLFFEFYHLLSEGYVRYEGSLSPERKGKTKRKLDLTGAIEMNRLYPNSRRESIKEDKYLNTLPRRGEDGGRSGLTKTRQKSNPSILYLVFGWLGVATWWLVVGGVSKARTNEMVEQTVEKLSLPMVECWE
ncbi:hypothetical protein TNCV_2201481 [Trichonephila clavipes]|nr:hypothetical protein TNCV_2201481 [Trichonephila clavipes]